MEEEVGLTEPSIVDDVFVTGAAVEISDHVVRVVGWVQLPHLAGDAKERRIVVRFVMPLDVAVRLRDEMAKRLPRIDGKRKEH